MKRKAAERLAAEAARADAAALLAHVGNAPVDDPLGELAKVAREVLALKDALAQRVNALEDLETAGGAGVGAQLRSEVALYERAMDRCVKVLDVLARHGVLERAVAVEEEKQRVLGAAVVTAMDAVDMSVEDRKRFVDALRGAFGAA